MKNLYVLTILTFATSLLFTGCGKKDIPTESISVSETITETSESETVSETESIDVDAPPAEGMVRSRITNEWIDPKYEDLRPLAVMTPNEASAVPHTGISDASILYECNVEGNMTRMMAIYEGYEQIEKIGNVRSLRDYYAYWAFEWDAIITHFGGPYYIDDVIAQPTTDNLSGTVLNEPFYRTSDRVAPHNAYIDPSKVADVLDAHNISPTVRDLADETHYIFTNKSEPNTLEQYSSAEAATFIDMSECYPLTRAYFEYNPDDQLYYRSQHLSGSTDGPHIDAANGKQLSFSNIIIQANDYAVRDAKGYLWYATVDDSQRDAWFITNGKLIKGTWVKESDFGATRYYDENGEEIVFNTGKTMVMIIKDDSSFDYK